MKHFLLVILFLSGVVACLWADGTETWQQSKFEDFEKGSARGVAILSEGALELAPQFKALYTSPSTYLWAIASDPAGNVYAASGAPARIYRVQPDGKSEIIFEPKELQVQALIEHKGVVYAATSPDGKVYKLERGAAVGSQEKSASGWNATL